MIRYALILAIVVSIIGLTGTALDHASAVRGEQAIEREIGTVESAATSLFELEGDRSDTVAARRVIEVEIPQGSPAKAGTETLRFERIPDTGSTRVTYSVDGGVERTTKLPVPIRHADGGNVTLSDRTGSRRLVLAREMDSHGNPVVTIEEY